VQKRLISHYRQQLRRPSASESFLACNSPCRLFGSWRAGQQHRAADVDPAGWPLFAALPPPDASNGPLQPVPEEVCSRQPVDLGVARTTHSGRSHSSAVGGGCHPPPTANPKPLNGAAPATLALGPSPVPLAAASASALPTTLLASMKVSRALLAISLAAAGAAFPGAFSTRSWRVALRATPELHLT